MAEPENIFKKALGKTKEICAKISYDSPVILTYTLISLVILVLSYITGGTSNTLVFSVYKSSYSEPLTYVRILTHIFGHLSILDYANNFIVILMVGPAIEKKYGPLNTSLIIAITALVTGVIQILFISTPFLGANGIALSFILITLLHCIITEERIPLTLAIFLILFIVRDVATNSIDKLFPRSLGGAAAYFLITLRNSSKYSEPEPPDIPLTEPVDEKSIETPAGKDDIIDMREKEE